MLTGQTIFDDERVYHFKACAGISPALDITGLHEKGDGNRGAFHGHHYTRQLNAINCRKQAWVLKNSVIESPLVCGEVAASFSFLPRFNW
jgi:hypothetical protein